MILLFHIKQSGLRYYNDKGIEHFYVHQYII